MFQHLDIVLAFVLLMLVASLFITAGTQVVVSLLGLRGAKSQNMSIGIGGDLVGRTPATPPGMRVRTGRFEKLRS